MYENAQANDRLWNDYVTEPEPEPIAHCECCERELFAGDDAYRIDDDIYCTDCVSKIELMEE